MKTKYCVKCAGSKIRTSQIKAEGLDGIVTSETCLECGNVQHVWSDAPSDEGDVPSDEGDAPSDENDKRSYKYSDKYNEPGRCKKLWKHVFYDGIKNAAVYKPKDPNWREDYRWLMSDSKAFNSFRSLADLCECSHFVKRIRAHVLGELATQGMEN